VTVAALVAIAAPAIDAVVDAHAALRAKRPLVQALTNTVSSNFVANVLLSAGASPAMVDNPEEAALFAGIADGVLINLGTPTAAQVEAMRLAAAAAQKAGKPWVLDPIAAGGLPWRGQVAAELLRFKPAAVRGNASEIIGLAGLGGGRAVWTAPRAPRPLSRLQLICWRTREPSQPPDLLTMWWGTSMAARFW
jgi:hydroxyethylthiazole kinase